MLLDARILALRTVIYRHMFNRSVVDFPGKITDYSVAFALFLVTVFKYRLHRDRIKGSCFFSAFL